MHIFVRGLEGCRALQLDEASTSAAGLKAAIQDLCGLPASEQLLVHRGRVLHTQADLVERGLQNDDEIHVHLRLRGGKGGFGALLRGQGRDGKVTTNFDACRDLNGKRLRLVNAEKKLVEWQSKAQEREAEKQALQQAKEEAKKEQREQEAQVNVAEVKAEQQKAVQKVQEAVQDALKALPEVAAAAAAEHKRKREAEAKPADKKPKMLAMLEALSSDSDSDSGSDRESEASAGTAE